MSMSFPDGPWQRSLEKRLDELHKCVDDAAWWDDSPKAMRLVYQIEALERMLGDVHGMMTKWAQNGSVSISKAKAEACAVARGLLSLELLYLGITTARNNLEGKIAEICVTDQHGQVVIDCMFSEHFMGNRGKNNWGAEHMETSYEIWPAVSKSVQDRFIAIFGAAPTMDAIKRDCELHNMPWHIRDVNVFCIKQLYLQFSGGSQGGEIGDQLLLKQARHQGGDFFPSGSSASTVARLTMNVLHDMAKDLPDAMT